MILLAAGEPPPEPSDAAAEGTPPALVAAAMGDVDFARYVEPILKQHCLRCHDERRRLGGLSLASRAHAELGGDSRVNPLQAGPDNPLLARVTSPDEDERMPLDSPPLSPEQIELLRRWIEAGAVWPEPIAAASTTFETPDPTLVERVGAWIDWWDAARLDRIRPAGYALIAALVFILVVERLKRRTAAAESAGRVTRGGIADRLSRLPRSAYAALVLATLAAGLVLYSRGLLRDLTSAEESLREARLELQEALALAAGQSSYAENEIYWPKHPPRLGGEYFRGNDERNERLFNGGVYRTAVFRLDLRDASDRVLQPGDKADGPLNIRLEIRRAAQATPSLFTDAVLGHACLSPIPPKEKPKTDEETRAAEKRPPKSTPRPEAEARSKLPSREAPADGGPFLLQTVEKGECWEARAPLPALNAEAPLVGMLYLYTSLKQSADDGVDKPHYAIAYRLLLDDAGRLTPDSTLHLGSMYNVPGVMAVPPDRIAPSEWLDYRPLPEIEGPAATDRHLLGVDEHIKPTKPGATPPADSRASPSAAEFP